MKLHISVFLLFSLRMSSGIGRVCRWHKRSGICVPIEDCFGKGQPVWGTCGRNICCLDPMIVRKKCTEYKNKIFGKQKKGGETNPIQDRVIGGEAAATLEFPYMASIGVNGTEPLEIDWQCGGTVISPNFVLTAAHCITKPVWSIWILAGSVYLDDPFAELHQASKAIKHPRYNRWKHQYDVGLLRVDEPFPLSKKIVPACLMFQYEQEGIEKAIATGWGKTRENDVKGVNLLRKVELEIIELNDCKIYFPTMVKYGGFVPSMLCAGHLSGGRDTCQGDSGGPLAIKMENSSFGILGLLSSGSGCGWPNSPAIYSSVSYFLTWITKMVWTRPTENDNN